MNDTEYVIEAGSILKTAYKAIASALKKVYRRIEPVLEDFAEWVIDENIANVTKPASIVFELLPSSDDEDWKTSDLYRLLVKPVAVREDYAICDFYLKPKGGETSDTISKTGVKFELNPDESEEDATSRIEYMINEIGQSLLSEISDNTYESIADIRQVA